MTELLKNYVAGRWVEGRGPAAQLSNPVTGAPLVRASAGGLDLAGAYEYARSEGGEGLRALTYGQRAALLAKVAEVLKANRDRYLDISIDNSGTTKADSSPDVDGAIFTLGYFAKLGVSLGDARYLLDGASAPLDKGGTFQARHVLVPTRGLALCINAFNFPAWGLWEKAAPALLSGVPVVVKPATSTCWLTHQMVTDVIGANILPKGALSLICGAGDGVLDPLARTDLVSFTGSAMTAAGLRAHRAIARDSVRINVEADSLNSMLLASDVSPGTEHFGQFVRDAVKELCIKSGQRCTAPRRLFVSAAQFDSARDALSSALSGIKVGNPRSEGVRMGTLVSRAQKQSVLSDLSTLRAEADVIFDGDKVAFVDADAASACVAPTLLAVRDAAHGNRINDVEVFGPIATLIAYRDHGEATRLIRRGGGSLVASIYAQDPDDAVSLAVDLADTHGRLHVVTPAVATAHTGHGNVMPAAIHGGPGRAGGGEELGGLRALNFYHRRAAIQVESSGVIAIDAAGKAI